MTSETGAETLLSDQSVVYHALGIGSFPWACFGALTLTERELAFKADVLLWTPPLQRYAIRKITSARARPGRRARTRRLMWMLFAALIPVTGLLGLPWLAAFWRRAGSATLEIYVRRWLFGGRHVFIVDNPAQWADAINRLIGASGGGEDRARGS
jgi:hypothetical protein